MTTTQYFAHRRDGEDCAHWQPLIEHLKNTAELAKQFGQDAGVAELAYIAGLVHDLGKYSAEFQKRLKDGPRVDHSTAGAKELKALFEGQPQAVFAQLLAYPILGHHAGLPDYGGETDLEGGTVCARLKKIHPRLQRLRKRTGHFGSPLPAAFTDSPFAPAYPSPEAAQRLFRLFALFPDAHDLLGAGGRRLSRDRNLHEGRPAARRT